MRGLRAQRSATRRSVWSLSVAYEGDASVLGRSNLQRELGFITTVHSDLPPWRLPALRGHEKTFDLGLSAKRFQRSGATPRYPASEVPCGFVPLRGSRPTPNAISRTDHSKRAPWRAKCALQRTLTIKNLGADAKCCVLDCAWNSRFIPAAKAVRPHDMCTNAAEKRICARNSILVALFFV